jgi:hypothetical protein
MTVIIIDKKGQKLEDISKEDVLFFPRLRLEKVTEFDKPAKKLCTEREVVNTEEDSKEFPFKRQKIAYEQIELLTSDSVGRVYDSTRVSAEEYQTQLKRMAEEITNKGSLYLTGHK